MATKLVNFGFKTQLLPTNRDRRYFVKASGTQRFAFNEAWKRGEELDEAYGKVCEEAEARGEKPRPRTDEEKFSESKFRKEINKIKHDKWPWMDEVTKCAVQQGIIDYGLARSRHFKNPKQFKRPKKKNHKERKHLYMSNEQFEVQGNKLWVPKLGWVKMCESLPPHTKILNVVISEKAGKWYASFALEGEKNLPEPKQKQRIVGVDLNVKEIVCSTGERFSYPGELKVEYRRMQRLQRQFSRKKKGSNRRKKLGLLLAKSHKRIADIRRDFLHKLTTYLVKTYGAFGIEDLNVKGMVRNHNLARVISNASFGEFRRQLEYKAGWRGVEIWVADRFFPSSKTCSACGAIYNELTLGMREWICPSCGQVHDRDLNAALNLEKGASRALRGVA